MAKVSIYIAAAQHTSVSQKLLRDGCTSIANTKHGTMINKAPNLDGTDFKCPKESR